MRGDSVPQLLEFALDRFHLRLDVLQIAFGSCRLHALRRLCRADAAASCSQPLECVCFSTNGRAIFKRDSTPQFV